MYLVSGVQCIRASRVVGYWEARVLLRRRDAHQHRWILDLFAYTESLNESTLRGDMAEFSRSLVLLNAANTDTECVG